MAQSPHRSHRLWGLDPLPIQPEDDTPTAQQPEQVNLFEIDRESTNQSGIEVSSEGSGVSTPIRDPSGFYSSESFSPNLAIPTYSAFSFEPNTPLSLEALT